MSITISYASRRSEVWRWYWRSWRRMLWKFHALIFATLVILESFFRYGRLPREPSELGTVAAIGIVPILLMPLYPLIRFKPQLCSFTADDRRISTSIGRKHGRIAWQDIAAVRMDGDFIVIERRNLNAFVIPPRAFQDNVAKLRFYDFVSAMVRDARSG